MQVFKEIQNCKLPTNMHLSLLTLGFSLLQNIQKKRKYKLTVKVNHFQNQKMLKQNISYTYLSGAHGPSFILLFLHLLFLGTITINLATGYKLSYINANVNFTHIVLFPHNKIP